MNCILSIPILQADFADLSNFPSFTRHFFLFRPHIVKAVGPALVPLSHKNTEGIVLKTGIKKSRAALLLACALTIGACCGGVYSAVAQRVKHTAQLRESTARVQELSEALSFLHSGRESYLADLSAVQNGENAYETQKDLVRIAKEAVEKRRAELARNEASGALSGDALEEARSELRQLNADFDAQEKAVADFESMKAKIASYEKVKTQARALLETLRENTHIRAKLDAGMGPIAGARQALAEEATGLRRRFYIVLSVFAALGISALVVLSKALAKRD